MARVVDRLPALGRGDRRDGRPRHADRGTDVAASAARRSRWRREPRRRADRRQPLLLFHFHEVPGMTIVANLVAFPAVSPALLLGIAASVLGLVSAATRDSSSRSSRWFRCATWRRRDPSRKRRSAGSRPVGVRSCSSSAVRSSCSWPGGCVRGDGSHGPRSCAGVAAVAARRVVLGDRVGTALGLTSEVPRRRTGRRRPDTSPEAPRCSSTAARPGAGLPEARGARREAAGRRDREPPARRSHRRPARGPRPVPGRHVHDPGAHDPRSSSLLE